MYKAILENISGIEIWPVIGLIIFFTFFTGVLIWAIRMKKEDVAHMANLPLSENDQSLIKGDVKNG